MQGKPGMRMSAKQGMPGKQGMQAHGGMHARSGMKGKPGMKQGGMMNFTAEQQEQLKTLKVEQMKSMTQFRNKLGEFNAKMKTITSADDVNLKDVDKLLDEMGEVKLEMAKNQLAFKQSIRAMLTDEQKVMMDMHR
jgi:Spy/CpxP family protein refolding chaperone